MVRSSFQFGEDRMRVYNERVEGQFLKIRSEKEDFLIRKSAKICFDSSNTPIGCYIGTSPGAFKASREWNQFINNKSQISQYKGIGTPDLTMQNIIKVIKDAYKDFNLAPTGYLDIINISSLVEPKSELVEKRHANLFEHLIRKNNDLIQELVQTKLLSNEQNFISSISSYPFVIMGFAAKPFKKQVSVLQCWKNGLQNVVIAYDNKKRISHPRRWRTEPELHLIAVEELKKIIGKNITENPTIQDIRWIK